MVKINNITIARWIFFFLRFPEFNKKLKAYLFSCKCVESIPGSNIRTYTVFMIHEYKYGIYHVHAYIKYVVRTYINRIYLVIYDIYSV